MADLTGVVPSGVPWINYGAFCSLPHSIFSFLLLLSGFGFEIRLKGFSLFPPVSADESRSNISEDRDPWWEETHTLSPNGLLKRVLLVCRTSHLSHTHMHNSLQTVFYSLCCCPSVNTARPSHCPKTQDVKQKQDVMKLRIGYFDIYNPIIRWKTHKDGITNAGTISPLLKAGRPVEFAANACKEPWESGDKRLWKLWNVKETSWWIISWLLRWTGHRLVK